MRCTGGDQETCLDKSFQAASCWHPVGTFSSVDEHGTGIQAPSHRMRPENWEGHSPA